MRLLIYTFNGHVIERERERVGLQQIYKRLACEIGADIPHPHMSCPTIFCISFTPHH